MKKFSKFLNSTLYARSIIKNECESAKFKLEKFKNALARITSFLEVKDLIIRQDLVGSDWLMLSMWALNASLSSINTPRSHLFYMVSVL